MILWAPLLLPLKYLFPQGFLHTQVFAFLTLSDSIWSPCVIPFTLWTQSLLISMVLKSSCNLSFSASSKTLWPTVYQIFPPYCHTGTSNSTCSNLKSSSCLPHTKLLLLQHFLLQIGNLGFFQDWPSLHITNLNSPKVLLLLPPLYPLNLTPTPFPLPSWGSCHFYAWDTHKAS